MALKNEDLSRLAVESLPGNTVINDDAGLPGVYVERPQATLNQLLNTTSTLVHPAFMLHGAATLSKISFGKYQASPNNGLMYSLPGKDPANTINLNNFVAACRAKGTGHHCITAAEWAYLALQSKRRGTMPLGNNNYGKDASENFYQAIPSTPKDAQGGKQRVETGTGPVTWSDTHDAAGVYDLNGNVHEWICDLRLVYGELQVIPWNDAALAETDISATSTAWRAINAAATGYEDLFIEPDGSGTTLGSIKLDYVSSHWQWQAADISDQSNSSRGAGFAATTIASDVSNTAALYLQAMALAPEAGDSDYGGDYLYANNGAVERCAFRSGYWSVGAIAGVFFLGFDSSRYNTHGGIGGRPCYIGSPVMDGAKATYDKIMRDWFVAKGANSATPAQLTALCDEWYSMYRTGWDGYSTFPLPSTNPEDGSTGTKGGSNAGLVCEPSTNIKAGRDDYAGLPQFAVKDCNWVLDDSTGDIIITAIDGITDNFVRNDPTVFVGVLQMSMYHYHYDTSTTYVHGLCDKYISSKQNIAPYPEAVKVDGTVRSWVCHSKYMSGLVGGKMTACAGVVPRAFDFSHDSLISTYAPAIGSKYSGSTIVDWGFLFLMTMIKYASITQDGRIQGCVNNDYQYYAAAGETGVKRVLLSPAQAAQFPVGSTVLIGVYNGSSTDRGQAQNYSVTGNGGAIVTAVQSVIIGSTTYGAVYVNTTSAFNTVGNGSAASGNTIISTWHWPTGINDSVLGNDGSVVNAASGKYPAKIQGIEYSVGGREVFSDVILQEIDSVYKVLIAKRTAAQKAGATSGDMVLSSLTSPKPDASGLTYIIRQAYDNAAGIFFGTQTGSQSGVYTKDGFYKDEAAIVALVEWLELGALVDGSENGGLSCLYGDVGLGYRHWTVLSRLSCNGNRG